MRVAVTGAAGFIGHHLVRTLVTLGHEVLAIDNFSFGHVARLQDLGADACIWPGDVRDADGLARVLTGSEVVLHQAARVSVAASFTNPRLTASVNVDGTSAVVAAAARAGVRRVVLASSASVYGEGAGFPLRETQGPAPSSPYAASKAAAERVLRQLGTFWGIETVALRYFNVFGPGQDATAAHAAVIPAWLRSARSASAPVLYGDGSATRDFTYVDDVVAANLLAMAAPKASGAVINIGTGEERSVLDLLGEVNQCLGRELRPDLRPARHGDVSRSVADISLARELLGYRTGLPFRVAVARTVAWYAEHGTDPRGRIRDHQPFKLRRAGAAGRPTRPARRR